MALIRSNAGGAALSSMGKILNDIKGVVGVMPNITSLSTSGFGLIFADRTCSVSITGSTKSALILRSDGTGSYNANQTAPVSLNKGDILVIGNTAATISY